MSSGSQDEPLTSTTAPSQQIPQQIPQSHPQRKSGTGLRPIATRSAIVPRDAESEKALRRRVTQGLPKARRHFDPNRIELSLPQDFSPGMAAPHMQPQPSQLLLGEPAKLSGHSSMLATNTHFFSPGPTTILGAGRVDPFNNYPIKMNDALRSILDQLFVSTDPVLTTFRESWLPIAVTDASTFHQVLASVAGKLGRLRGGDQASEDIMLMHHSLAMRTVSQNLSNPALLLSDCTLGSVAILVCFSTATRDWPSFEAHMGGLERLHQLRGGFESVEKNPVLRRILFAVDVAGAYTLDKPPRFPFPSSFIKREQEALFPQASQRPEIIPTQWRFIFPISNPLIAIFDDILIALTFAKMKIERNEIWNRHSFSTFFLDPIAYHLFSTMSTTDLTTHWGKIHEATRLGIILFFGEIRHQTGALAVLTSPQMRKLKDFLIGAGSDIDWSAAPQLLLWIVFFGFFESWDEPEHEWYLALLVKLARKLELQSWDGVVNVVRSFLWIGEVHDEKLRVLRVGFDLQFGAVRGGGSVLPDAVF